MSVIYPPLPRKIKSDKNKRRAQKTLSNKSNEAESPGPCIIKQGNFLSLTDLLADSVL